MSWPFDTTAPHITADGLLAHFSGRLGLTADDLGLPSTLLATWQDASLVRLTTATAAALPKKLATTPGAASIWITSVLVGETPSGRPVGVARLPVGAPATTILLEMAIARGARDILVCGSAGSLRSELPIGSAVVVSGAQREDGTSHHYLPAGEVVAADEYLTELLVNGLRASGVEPARGRSWTIDAIFRETASAIARHQNSGIAVVEMESAAIFAVAKVRGARAGLVATVSDEIFHPWIPGFHLPEFREALERAADALVRAADAL